MNECFFNCFFFFRCNIKNFSLQINSDYFHFLNKLKPTQVSATVMVPKDNMFLFFISASEYDATFFIFSKTFN